MGSNLKGFLLLYGDNNAKTNFIDKLKKDYWVWNPNPLSFLRYNAGQLGWEFTNDCQANDFIQSMLDLSNDHLDFEFQYIKKFIDKTLISNKSVENGKLGDVLVVSVNKELAERLLGEYDFSVVKVTDGECVHLNFENDRYVIGMGDTDENIENAISSIFKFVMIDVDK
ncbi:MAG: hypothetical protein WA061_02650 [Microgenomates group bacterium]